MVKASRARRAHRTGAAEGLESGFVDDRIYSDLAPRLLREATRRLASSVASSHGRMKILVLGINYAPEKVGIAVYTTGMAEALARMGHDVQVIAGQPYYPAWKPVNGSAAWAYSQDIENGIDVLRCPHYVPASPSAARRVLHHLSFAISALLPVLARAWREKPDVVLAIAPSLVAAPAARFAALLSGAKSWLHVQDFELEAAIATGLLRKQGFGTRLARAFERAVLGGFDRVSSISPQMCRRLAQKGVSVERIVEFRNWADTEAIRPLRGPSAFRAKWNITTPHVALYSGSIGNKQGIEIVIEAARRLVHRQDLTFVICGEGPHRAKLEELAAGLTNIQFHDLQPSDLLNDLLGLATVHLMPQVAGAADLVLPSKLGNMLASGRPIVATAEPGTGLASEVEGCGVVVPPGDVDAFVAGIANLLDRKILCNQASILARLRAQDRWARNEILARLEWQFDDLADRAREPAFEVAVGRG
jgi:colanic acid biosynthesis glycosyl transferase WcaI